MIEPRILRRLLEPEGQQALQAAMDLAPQEADFLPTFQRLSRRFPADLARAAAEQAILRRKAREKFASAERMYFASEALEQATPEAVAAYRASRFTGLAPIFDMACGLGGDATALARVGPVVAVDRDRLRLMLLAANAAALGLTDRLTLVRADLHSPAWRFPSGAGAFYDPARRVAGHRVRSVLGYQPPLDLIDEWLPHLAGLAAKLSPGVDLAEVAHYDCEIEFVALGNELKEALLWFGALKTVRRRATVLPGPETLTAETEPDLPVGAPGAYLYEPNPAVIRAGMVRTLGAMLEARLLDRTIAYLTAERLTPTPFARAYQVLDTLPFQLKRLRARLRQMGAGPITVKKRGSALEPEELIRRLGLKGDQPVTIVLTRVLGKPHALIVREAGGVEEQAPSREKEAGSGTEGSSRGRGSTAHPESPESKQG